MVSIGDGKKITEYSLMHNILKKEYFKAADIYYIMIEEMFKLFITKFL
jgi:hypothetical protein